MTPGEVEGSLQAHPGVRDATVVCQDDGSSKKLIAYVVPEMRYLEKLRGAEGHEPKSLQKWRKTFDLMQATKEAVASSQGFNIAGWNSSYTRQPIAAKEMREWVEETVSSIESFKPRKILEIGCGTGLLLLRLAPRCERYVGTDFSAAALKRVEEQLVQVGALRSGVELLERPADNFAGFATESFDTLVLNSVVQYFPSAAYLLRVLELAISRVRPGGRIFVGDVLSLPLLRAYSASVEIFQAPDSATLWSLREKVSRRIKQQPHLVISPAFFFALQKRHRQISRVEIRPKRSRFDNELSRFRFDATIFLDQETEPAEHLEWLDWRAEEFGGERLRSELKARHDRPLALRAVPNARVWRDVAAAKMIASAEQGLGIIEDLRAIPDDPQIAQLHPSALFAMAQDLDFDLDWSWASACSEGSFDLIFRRRSVGQRTTAGPVAWPQASVVDDDFASHTNLPGQATLENKLTQELVAHCRREFSVLPALDVVLVDAISAKSVSKPHEEMRFAPPTLR